MGIRHFLKLVGFGSLLFLFGCDSTIRTEPVTGSGNSDNLDLGITLVSTQASPTNSAISVTAVFGKAPNQFSKNLITVLNGTADSFVKIEPKIYSFLVRPQQDGPVEIQILADKVSDPSSRFFTASNKLSFIFDQTLPTLRDLSFASGSTSFNPTPTVNFRLNKSANVSLFLGACSDEFEISQKENKQGDGSIESIQVTQSFTLDGSYPVLIQAQLGDKKGDCVKVGDYLFDTERPTVSLSSSAPFLLNGPFLVTATFSESITGLEANDIFVDGGTVSGSPSVVSGTNYKQYRFTVAPLAQGLITVRVASNSAIDSAGNFNLVSENLTRNHDSVRPSVVLSSTATEYVNSSYPVKAVFSESVSGLLLSDLQVTGGTASGLNELPGTDSKEYEFTINPSVEGDVTVTVGSDSAFDAATNGNSASNSLLRVHDTLSPTVSITSSAPSYVNGPFQAKAVFSEPVTGFTISGIELAQASSSGITGVPETYVTGYGFREYTFTVTPSQEGQVNLSIKAGAVSDRVGNPNSASGTPLTRTYDITRPALVSLTSASSLLVNAPFVISLEFDEPMGSVESSDLVLSQGSASAPTEVPGSNGTRWQFTISPNQQGSISVSILTNGANDLAGNGVLASGETVTRTFDNVNPSVTLSSPANPYVNAPFTVIAEFSEVVNGFTLSDVSVTRANLGSLQTLETDKKFQFTVTPTSEGTVSLNVIASGVTDPTGNTNTASTSLTRVYDTTRPSVTLSSSSSQNVNGPFLVVATFSESMASFDSNALSVSGGSTSAPAAISGTNNQQWEFTITPQLSGSVTVQVLVNTAPDLAGNFNTASALLSRTFDETAPVISAIALTPSASPTNETNLKVDFSVNEVATLALHNGSLCTSPLSGTLSLVSGAQSLTTYSLPDGTYSVYVRAQDQAGNVSCTVAKASHLVDTTAPQNGSISITNANPTNSNSLSLALWAEDATAIQMQVSLTDLATPTCSGTWESFSASKIVTIPELLKNKTVYADVRYRDAVLNQTSCLRTQIVHDNLPPADPSAITINDGAAVTNSSGVTVKVTSGDAPYGVALSQNTSFCTNDSFLVTWVAFGAASTKSLSHTLTILNATNTVYARVRDQAGNISGCVSSSIIHSNTAPINPGISIESGAARTNKTQVTLTLSMTPSGSNDIEMYITNTSGCSAGGTWADYSATALHTLSPLNQTTTVYVKYRDKLAPYFETDCVSDSIYHDNIAPLGTGISLNSGEAATPYPWISIYLHSSMQEDPWSEYQMNVFESSDCTGSSLTGGWTYYYDWLGYNVPYAKLNTQLYFSAKFRDLTGNETVCASATILHDDRQPYISYIDKASGPLAGGVSATIAGGNFRSGAEASVYFGSRKATCSLVGAPVDGVYSQLSCTVPAPSPALNSAQSVNVRVTNPSTLYADATYTYQEAPSISNSSPGTGLTRTGDLITLNGAFFRDGITVTVGGLDAAQVSRINSNQITFVTPAFSTVGSRNIVVKNTDNQTATLFFQFTQRCTELCGGTNNSCYNQTQATQALCATLEDGNQATLTPTYVDLVTRIPTVYIESNKKETTSQRVTLSLSASYLNATEMYVTSSSGCSGGGVWEPYALKKVWTLPGTGTQSVYVQYRNAIGETTSCVSDSIIVNGSSSNQDYLAVQFQVWKELDGTKILSADGLWGGNWQRKLNSTGKGYSATSYAATQTNLEQLENRANPVHTYLDDTQKFVQNRWIYYSKKATFISLKTGYSSKVEAVDWLDKWGSVNTTNGSDPAWYEGNISTCSNFGMRLPTAYETQMSQPANSRLPLSDGTPTFAGSNGVPSSSNVTWTATADTSALESDSFWCYYKDADNNNAETPLSIPSGAFYDVRCVLP